MARKQTKDKAPAPIVTLTDQGLSAATAYDAEELAKHAYGTEFDLVSRTKRSDPQQGTYWKTLTNVVDATGRWKNREALHTAIKIELGRVEPLFDMSGRVIGFIPDSTSFERMTHKEFCEYMNEAMAMLADAIGYDPLEWMKR